MSLTEMIHIDVNIIIRCFIIHIKLNCFIGQFILNCMVHIFGFLDMCCYFMLKTKDTLLFLLKKNKTNEFVVVLA